MARHVHSPIANAGCTAGNADVSPKNFREGPPTPASAPVPCPTFSLCTSVCPDAIAASRPHFSGGTMFPRRNRWYVALLPLCLLLSAAPSLRAQNTFAALHGTVTDTSGAVIPNASVVVLNTGTNLSTQTKTDDGGYYVFPQLAASTFINGSPASTYTVTVSATGFQQFQATGLVLNLNDNKDVDAALKVGSSATTVQVQTSAVQVQTSDTQLSTEVTASEIEDMPLLGRDVVQLQKTAPGVAEMSDRLG